MKTQELLKQVHEILRANQVDINLPQAEAQPETSSLTPAYAKKKEAMERRQQQREAERARIPEMIDALKKEFPAEASQYIDGLLTANVPATNNHLLPNALMAVNPPVSNLGFELDVYESILPYAKLAWFIENNGTPEEHAYKLAVMFGDAIKALHYVQSYADEHKNDTQPFHNSCLFQLPAPGPNWNVEAWRRLANGGQKPMLNEKFRKCLARARDVEGKLVNIEKATIKEILECYNTLLYKGVTNDNVPIAEIFNHYGASQQDFDKYIQEVLPQARLKNTETNNIMIPDTVFDGATVGFPGYYIEKMHHLDPMCAMLGHKTGCCQSIGGQGEPCTIYGITNERSGFYVLRKGNPNNRKPNDDIKAQSWAWRGSNDLLVLDSIEVQNNVLEAKIGEKDGNDLICAMYQGFAKKLIEEHNVPEVRVGTAGQTPDEVGENYIGQYSFPLNYVGYRDSRKQRCILHRDALWLQFIDDSNTADNEPLFIYLNNALATNPDVGIMKNKTVRTFILWTSRSKGDLLRNWMTQPCLANSKHIKQLTEFLEHVETLQSIISNKTKLLELVESPDTPDDVFSFEFATHGVPLPLLHWAIHWQNERLFQALLKRKIDVNITSKNGKTALLLAIEDKNPFALKLMEIPGIDLNGCDDLGNTPLILAISSVNADIAEKLIANDKVDVNADNYAGTTALFLAIEAGKVNLVSLLLKRSDLQLLPFSVFDRTIWNFWRLEIIKDVTREKPSSSQNTIEMIATFGKKLPEIFQNIQQIETFFCHQYPDEIKQAMIREMGPTLRKFITTTDDYHRLIFSSGGLGGDEQVLFIEAFGDLQRLVNTCEDLGAVLHGLHPIRQKAVYLQLGSKINAVVNSFEDYEKVIRSFSPYDKKDSTTLFTLQLFDKIPQFDLNAEQFVTILQVLNETEREMLMAKFDKAKIAPLEAKARRFFARNKQ